MYMPFISACPAKLSKKLARQPGGWTDYLSNIIAFVFYGKGLLRSTITFDITHSKYVFFNTISIPDVQYKLQDKNMPGRRNRGVLHSYYVPFLLSS